MSTQEARNVISKDDRITNANLLALVDGGELALHSHAHAATPFSGTAYFTSEVDNGNSGSADTINWTVGNKQKSTLTDDCTFTFSPEPGGPCNLILKLIQGGSGSYTVTWPGDVNWAGGVPPVLTTTVGAVDIISFYYDGSEFHGQVMLDSK